jgi:hypothetical protein
MVERKKDWSFVTHRYRCPLNVTLSRVTPALVEVMEDGGERVLGRIFWGHEHMNGVIRAHITPRLSLESI